MTKLHHTQYKKNYRNYILSCINSEDCELKTDQDKIKHLFNRFYSEYSWNIKRVGKKAALSEWLSGLAIDIEYYNDDIIKLAIDLGSIDNNPSEKLQEKVLSGYWDFMANMILNLEREVINV